MSQIQYDLQKVDSGWVNIAVNNAWDWFYYLYYASYLIIGLLVVWRWGNKPDNKEITKQSNLIIYSFVIAFTLGSIFDVGASSILKRAIPQMTPIFILLPTWAMYYSARYYGLMDRIKTKNDEIILTDEDQKNIFKNLGLAFCAGGILTFISEYVPYINGGIGELKTGLIKGGILFALGIVLHMVQKIQKKSLKETLTLAILVLSIPIAIFPFIEDGGLTVWVFPSIIIMSSLIFSRRTLLIATTIMAIITQRLMWILKPEATVLINEYDYIARIGMFILAFLVGLYINKLYVAKIKENKNQVEFQKFNADISLEFVNISQENIGDKINKLLSVIFN